MGVVAHRSPADEGGTNQYPRNQGKFYYEILKWLFLKFSSSYLLIPPVISGCYHNPGAIQPYWDSPL